MKVKVKIVGVLLKPIGKSEVEIDISDGKNLKELLLELKYNEKHLSYIMASINGELKTLEYELKHNDEIILSTIVGGG